MKNKIINYVVIAGIIILIVGFYAMFFKAGIPFPDATPEMARRWLFYYNFGKFTMLSGIILIVTSIVLKLFGKPKK